MKENISFQSLDQVLKYIVSSGSRKAFWEYAGIHAEFTLDAKHNRIELSASKYGEPSKKITEQLYTLFENKLDLKNNCLLVDATPVDFVPCYSNKVIHQEYVA